MKTVDSLKSGKQAEKARPVTENEKRDLFPFISVWSLCPQFFITHTFIKYEHDLLLFWIFARTFEGPKMRDYYGLSWAETSLATHRFSFGWNGPRELWHCRKLNKSWRAMYPACFETGFECNELLVSIKSSKNYQSWCLLFNATERTSSITCVVHAWYIFILCKKDEKCCCWDYTSAWPCLNILLLFINRLCLMFVF